MDNPKILPKSGRVFARTKKENVHAEGKRLCPATGLSLGERKARDGREVVISFEGQKGRKGGAVRLKHGRG